jgi:hypothetical protein
MERVLGTPALFATAYGNVGSSIYYALGVTASFALGLTPLVFAIAGVIFAATAASSAESTVRYPEAGGSSSFARHAFDELVSFGAAWSQTLVYVVTIATSAFFVPHYLAIFWEPLRTNPWDIVGGAVVIVALVALNIVGVQEAARLSVVLAVIDFATQVLLVLMGMVLVFSPQVLVDNIHWGIAPTWSNFAIAIPIARLAYTGIETVSNLAEEARQPARTIPGAIKLVAFAVFAIYLTLPLVALSAMPVERIDGELTTLLGLPPEQGGYANDPVRGAGVVARGVRRLPRLPPLRIASPSARHGESTAGIRRRARARVSADRRPDRAGSSVRRRPRPRLPPCGRARGADHRADGAGRAAGAAARRAAPGGGAGGERRARRGGRDRRYVRRACDGPSRSGTERLDRDPARRRAAGNGDHRPRLASQVARRPPPWRLRDDRRPRAPSRALPGDDRRIHEREPRMNWYSRAIVVFSLAFIAIGIALLVVTAVNGGGAVGFVLGGLFVALGVARIQLERKRHG